MIQRRILLSLTTLVIAFSSLSASAALLHCPTRSEVVVNGQWHVPANWSAQMNIGTPNDQSNFVQVQAQYISKNTMGGKIVCSYGFYGPTNKNTPYLEIYSYSASDLTPTSNGGWWVSKGQFICQGTQPNGKATNCTYSLKQLNKLSNTRKKN